jgi:hypothetical protein
MYTEQLTQALAVVGATNPQQLNGTDTSITDVDIAKYKRLLFIITLGAGGNSLNAKLRESKTAGGTYQDITGGAITAFTGTNKQFTIEIRADELDPGYEFVQLSITTGGANYLSAICLGGEGVHKPVGTSVGGNDIGSVQQRLVV